MIKQTTYAQAQIRALFKHFRDNERYEAHVNLSRTLRIARDRILADPFAGELYPSNYPGMAQWHYLWIKEHRYWIAWSMKRGYPVITNVFYNTSAMWRRVKPDSGRLLPR